MPATRYIGWKVLNVSLILLTGVIITACLYIISELYACPYFVYVFEKWNVVLTSLQGESDVWDQKLHIWQNKCN